MTQAAVSSTANRTALLAEERGTIQKVDEALRIALCFPERYTFAMSNLGFQTAYWHFNQAGRAKAERAFYEEVDAPITLESGRTIDEFDAIAFSIDYELSYPHILSMLQRSRICLFRTERAQRKKEPLVFCGGFITFFNVRPLAPFMDFFVMGEADDCFADLAARMVRYRVSGMSKADFLEELAGLSYIYVPGVSAVVPPAHMVQDVDAYDTVTRVLTPYTEFKSMFLVELMRGCYHSCAFCVAGNVKSGVRVRSLERVARVCEESMTLLRTKRFGFIAGAPSDYPYLRELCERLAMRGAELSFSSLRATTLKPWLLSMLVAQGQRSITIAPETGSDRLRATLAKNVSNEEFLRCVADAKEAGVQKVKMYMMIGLPGETADDSDESVRFLMEAGKILPVRVSVSPFIPKPHTPFENYTLASKAALDNAMVVLRRGLAKSGAVRLQCDGFKSAAIQAAYAKGDESVLMPLVEGCH